MLSSSYGDWKTDANKRTEQIRKGNFRITAISPYGSKLPVPGIEVKISQIKHHFAFGSCINNNVMTNTNYANFFKNHFEWAVMENESKWYRNELMQGKVDYKTADNIYNWCAANGIIMRGHCIYWEKEKYAQQWLRNLAYAPLPAASPLRSAVESRMNSVVNHFKGKFVHWDVDNEMLAGSFYKDHLGEAIWYWMFQAANQIDPNCRLFVNEYDVLSFGRYDTTPYKNLITNLRNNGAPIHAIGVQGHIEVNFNRTNALKVLDSLAQLGLPIWITEFDVNQADINLRANDMEDFYRIAFSHPAVEGILMWGFWEGSRWYPNWFIVNNDWTLNEAGRRYEALMDEWTTKNDSSITDNNGNADFRGFYGKYSITLTSAKAKPTVAIIDVTVGGPNDFTIELTNIGEPTHLPASQ